MRLMNFESRYYKTHESIIILLVLDHGMTLVR